MNEHGLPEMTPELIQEAKDIMATVKAFGKKLGLAHLDASIMYSYNKLCLYGSCDQWDDGTNKGFWSLDIFDDGSTNEKYLEFSHDEEEDA